MEQLDWTWIFEHALAWSCGDPDYAAWYLTDQADATSYQDLQSHPLACSATWTTTPPSTLRPKEGTPDA